MENTAAILEVDESSKPTTSDSSSFELECKRSKMNAKGKAFADYELDHRIISSSRFTKDDYSKSDANLISLDRVDIKAIKANTLSPREQEKSDELVLEAMHCLFNNQFMKAKRIFEQHANSDPLYAQGLGSMMFLKAIMAQDSQVTEDAIKTLVKTYQIATAQIDRATKHHFGHTVIEYLSTCRQYIRLSQPLPMHIKPTKPKQLDSHEVELVPNGVLRAHVVKAEACLQIAILYLLQENVTGYIKCGLNLRRAYVSYSIVWQEYKRAGQLHNEYMDEETISGIQFGIGTVHLILSSLPPKILHVISAFGWTADRHLGFALLKLCLEGQRARSPMASVMLLTYYTTLTSLCPQILASDYTQPAIETLLDAQRLYPHSILFLFLAGRTSRLARNLILSTQSFLYASEMSKREWLEVECLHATHAEMALNHMMDHRWQEALGLLERLDHHRYASQAVHRYLAAACLDMMGQRTEAILRLAEVPALIRHETAAERYVRAQVQRLQSSGYQDMDMTLCALEYLYFLNASEATPLASLEHSLERVDSALDRLVEIERVEYGLRACELVPETAPVDYEPQRGILLLLKVSILNALGRFQESVIHLNWMMDHRQQMGHIKWIAPHTFWYMFFSKKKKKKKKKNWV
ncbi:hypothetical protein G6F45_004145 [Rhizopus arrhizus]|nr:hypothetical protein G6F45_004145 [Rhizopus arrhizus]